MTNYYLVRQVSRDKLALETLSTQDLLDEFARDFYQDKESKQIYFRKDGEKFGHVIAGGYEFEEEEAQKFILEIALEEANSNTRSDNIIFGVYSTKSELLEDIEQFVEELDEDTDYNKNEYFYINLQNIIQQLK